MPEAGGQRDGHNPEHSNLKTTTYREAGRNSGPINSETVGVETVPRDRFGKPAARTSRLVRRLLAMQPLDSALSSQYNMMVRSARDVLRWAFQRRAWLTGRQKLRPLKLRGNRTWPVDLFSAGMGLQGKEVQALRRDEQPRIVADTTLAVQLRQFSL